MQVEEEEVVGEMDIGTKMYEPDSQEAENVPGPADMDCGRASRHSQN